MAEKTAAEKKAPARKRLAKGQTLQCQVCGLEVIVDEECSCVAEHEIICCSRPMREKAPAKAKAATKK